MPDHLPREQHFALFLRVAADPLPDSVLALYGLVPDPFRMDALPACYL